MTNNHIEILATYNDEDIAKDDAYQMFQTTIADWDLDKGVVTLNITTKILSDYGTPDVDISTVTTTYTMELDSVWELIFEDAENCYRAIHALATGYDGSHYNYMNIELKHID